IGVSTAYFLGRMGHRVVVLDRREGPGLEASFANGGMVTPSQSEPWNTPGILFKLISWVGREDAPVLLRLSAMPSLLGWGTAFLRHSTEARFRRNVVKNVTLASYSQAILKDLRQNHGLHYDAAQRGTIRMYRDRHSQEHAAGLCNMLRDSGVGCEVLDSQGVIGKEPALAPARDKITGGIFFSGDESGDAYDYCSSLAALAAKHGAVFQFDAGVTGFRMDGRRIRAVTGSFGELEGDRFVVAGGSESLLILKWLGLDLPVRPVKGYSLTLDVSAWDGRPLVPVIDDRFHIAVTPLTGRLRVAGTAEFCGFDLRLNADRIRNLSSFVADLYPQTAQFTAPGISSAWAGLRPYSCDGVPVMGPTRFENLFLNTGHGHLGWTMAAGSGKLIADLVSGNSPDLDLRPYQLDRF
ncbi:MAG: D-amino acid dehydrogenase, partial [Gammaproteobacteria bacterium]